jgi:hypothetical protein
VDRITITLEGPDAALALRELLSNADYDWLDVAVTINEQTDVLRTLTNAEVDELIEVLQRGTA